MKKFLLTYYGGTQPASKEEGDKVMAAWQTWMDGMGSALVDAGFPIMPGAKRVNAGMEVSEGHSGINGYTIIQAESMDDAVEIAKECPHLEAGGDVEIIEEMPLNM